MRITGLASCNRWATAIRLIAPQFVKPYAKTSKIADAEAICGAVGPEHALRPREER